MKYIRLIPFSILLVCSLLFGVGLFSLSSSATTVTGSESSSGVLIGYDDGTPVYFNWDDWAYTSYYGFVDDGSGNIVFALAAQVSGNSSFSLNGSTSGSLYTYTYGSYYWLNGSPLKVNYIPYTMFNYASVGLSSFDYYSSFADFQTDTKSSLIETGSFTFKNFRLLSSRTTSGSTARLYFYTDGSLTDGSFNSSFKYALVSSSTDVSDITFDDYTSSGTTLPLTINFPNNLTELYVFPVNSDGVVGNGVHFSIPQSWEDLSLSGDYVNVDSTSLSTYSSTTLSGSIVPFNDLSSSISGALAQISNFQTSSGELSDSDISSVSDYLIENDFSDIESSSASTPDNVQLPYDYSISSSVDVTITQSDFDDLGFGSDVATLSSGITDTFTSDLFQPFFQIFGVDVIDLWTFAFALPSFFIFGLILKFIFFK